MSEHWFDITILKILGMATLENLGEHAAQGLLKLCGKEAS